MGIPGWLVDQHHHDDAGVGVGCEHSVRVWDGVLPQALLWGYEVGLTVGFSIVRSVSGDLDIWRLQGYGVVDF